MSRNKKRANKLIFKRLDDYVAARGESISNSGQERWIGTEEANRRFLTDAKLTNSLAFSARLLVSQFDFDNRTYTVTAGFDTTDIPSGLVEEDLTGAILTAFLADSDLQPNSHILNVRQVVEYSDARTKEYKPAGHGFADIAGLFPNIRVFSSEPLQKKESENIFLLLCLADRRRVELWMEEALVTELERLASLGASRVPYSSLCKSCLDTDPGNLFLALYRSLENQYSRKKVTALLDSMEISRDWAEMARLLGDKLSWYPRELESLEELLKQVPEPIQAVGLEAFGVTSTPGTNQPLMLSKLIYDLRNTLVHYRPFHQAADPKLDWNKVCRALCNILCSLV